jgi:hypothetical protein
MRRPRHGLAAGWGPSSAATAVHDRPPVDFARPGRKPHQSPAVAHAQQVVGEMNRDCQGAGASHPGAARVIVVCVTCGSAAALRDRPVRLRAARLSPLLRSTQSPHPTHRPRLGPPTASISALALFFRKFPQNKGDIQKRLRARLSAEPESNESDVERAAL